jgi:glycosyltransferase involved in cell wall biosynthesis
MGETVMSGGIAGEPRGFRGQGVALVTNYARTAKQFRGHLIRELVNRRQSVYVLAPDYDGRTRMQVAALGAEPVDVSLQRTGVNPLRDCADLFRLAGRLRALGADIVFSFGAKAVVHGTLAACLAGVPGRFAMIEGLGSYFIEDGENGGLKKKMVRLLVESLYWAVLRFNSRVFFLNGDDLSELTRKGLVKKEKTVLIPGIGVDLAEFKQSLPRNGGEGLTFLLIARLLRDKGIAEYVDAARKVRERHPSASFLLVGSLDTNPSAVSAEELEHWQDEGVVKWLGVLDDVRGVLENADVYVLPSYREGMPRTILEALAVGRPVITTDVPGCRETVARAKGGEGNASGSGQLPTTGRVIHCGNGFLVPARDADALAEAMEFFIVNPELVSRMGTESRRLAEERFDVEKVDNTLLREMGLSPS